MEQIFKQITVLYGDKSTKKIYINVNLIECIEETHSAVSIKMQRGNTWLVEEPIFSLLERLQSK
jgi:uncharacterized protein YlzI (FlbEa/FlbD family)